MVTKQGEEEQESKESYRQRKETRKYDVLQPEESLEEIGIESLFSSAIVAISIFRIIHHFEKTPANRNGSKQVIDILISMWLTNFRGC